MKEEKFPTSPPAPQLNASVKVTLSFEGSWDPSDRARVSRAVLKSLEGLECKPLHLMESGVQDGPSSVILTLS